VVSKPGDGKALKVLPAQSGNDEALKELQVAGALEAKSVNQFLHLQFTLVSAQVAESRSLEEAAHRRGFERIAQRCSSFAELRNRRD